jgi:hypothetical protein
VHVVLRDDRHDFDAVGAYLPAFFAARHVTHQRLLGETDAEFLGPNLWKLSLKGFTAAVLRDAIAEAWHVPPEQIRIEIDPELPATSQLRLPKDKTILQPFN